MKLAEVGEFGFIGRIAKRVHSGMGVRIGIGDDAAAVETTPGRVSLLTADMLLEDVHFDLSYCDPVTLGRKSLAVNLSDIAAMGGYPRHCLLSLGIPHDMPVEFLDGFVTGLLQRADEYGVALVGGDTCASRGGLVISVTVLGEQHPERVVTRSGAKRGDLIVVTGTLGDSGLGLRLLKAGERQGMAVSRHLDPSPRVWEGIKLAEAALPSAMIDISDGLLADLGHILRLSGLGARVELSKLPLSDAVTAHIAETGPDGFVLPLAGGEDYELLFTIPPHSHTEMLSLLEPLGIRTSVIGEITAAGLAVIGHDGAPFPIAATGYNHFS